MPPEDYLFSFNAFSCVGLSIYFLDLPFGIRSGDARNNRRREQYMNIVPDSKIYFLQNIKLDDGYINTLNWSTLADQERYFRSNTYVFVDALSYIRISQFLPVKQNKTMTSFFIIVMTIPYFIKKIEQKQCTVL